jgi:hypothetical protein
LLPLNLLDRSADAPDRDHFARLRPPFLSPVLATSAVPSALKRLLSQAGQARLCGDFQMMPAQAGLVAPPLALSFH